MLIPELSYRVVFTAMIVILADFLIVRRGREISSNKLFAAAYVGSAFLVAMYVVMGPIFPAWIGIAAAVPSLVLLWRHHRSVSLEIVSTAFFFVVVPALFFKYAWDLAKPVSIAELWGPKRKEPESP